VDIGVMIPYLTEASGDQMLAWCRAIDDGPFGTIAIGERIAYTNLDQRVALAAGAAVTRRVRLMTHVLIAPIHQTGLLAKELASIDVVSNGRLTVAVGTGGREDDYRAAGSTMNRVFGRQDETVHELRRLWSGEPAFPGGDPIGPAPVQPGGPPIFTSARGPQSIARATAWADGFCGAALAGTYEAIKGEYEMFMDAWTAGGGQRKPLMSTSMFFALGEGAEARMRAVEDGYYTERNGVPLPAEYIATMRSQVFNDAAVLAAVEAAASVGYDQIVFIATTDDLRDLDRLAAVVSKLG